MIRYEDIDSDVKQENQHALYVPRKGEEVIMKARIFIVERVIHNTSNNLVRVLLKERSKL